MNKRRRKPRPSSVHNQPRKYVRTVVIFLDMLIISVLFFSYLYTHVLATNEIPDISGKEYRRIASFSGTLVPLIPVDENNVPTPPPLADNVVTHGPRDKKEVALTFDADMTEGMKRMLVNGEVTTFDDTRITDFLIQTQTKATFFLTGMWIEQYPEVTKELAKNALFELENHSYSHPSFDGFCYGLPQVPASELEGQITKTKQLLHDVAGITNKYFRFPGGCYDTRALGLVRQASLVVVHWDTAGSDGFNHNTKEIVHNVLDHVQNGSIIVLHIGGAENTPKTADALAEIVQRVKEKGYRFVTVEELLRASTQQASSETKNYFEKELNIVP